MGIGAIYLVISPAVAERFVFFPDPTDPGDAPTLAGVPGEDVFLETDDGVRVHGWWWEADPGAPAVLFLHGNAGNIAMRRGTAEEMLRRGISTFHLDYRGYGRSGGRPTEAGVYMDGEAALRWVGGEVGGTARVVVHGRSLGGVVAARLASTGDVAGLILESAFTSLDEMASVVYPILPSLLFRRLRGRFDALGALERIDVPVLVIHGTDDELIPFQMGEALHERANEPRALYAVEGAGHNDVPWVGGRRYYDRVAEFVRGASEGGLARERSTRP
jgi:uncharacterized protein